MDGSPCIFVPSRNNSKYSRLFLNAGAHIQHHYMFNSSVYKADGKVCNPAWYVSCEHDPLLELLTLYDGIIGEYLNSNYDLIIATGLTQTPYVQEKYYWRIKNHETFLQKLNIPFKSVVPRMTRDFLIEFSSNEVARDSEIKLKSIVSVDDNTQLFKEIENRGRSLFVTLTYPYEVKPGFKISYGTKCFDISDDLAFVAIKNGMHDPKGFMFIKGKIKSDDYFKDTHVKSIFYIIDDYFASD